MNIDLFLEELKKLSFNWDFLEKIGFDIEMISEMKSAFNPPKNKIKSSSGDILIKFIEEYDTGFSLISNITFETPIIEFQNKILVGRYKEDPIAIDKETEEVVIVTDWD